LVGSPGASERPLRVCSLSAADLAGSLGLDWSAAGADDFASDCCSSCCFVVGAAAPSCTTGADCLAAGSDCGWSTSIESHWMVVITVALHKAISMEARSACRRPPAIVLCDLIAVSFIVFAVVAGFLLVMVA
jgi:hypothetical protein